MELKDFIKTTLNEIVEAVSECSESTDGKIAPFFGGNPCNHTNLATVYDGTKHIVVTEVRFELSVQVEETNGVSGKGKITIIPAIFSGGIEGEVATKNSAANKLSFAVPIKIAENEKNKAPGPGRGIGSIL